MPRTRYVALLVGAALLPLALAPAAHAEDPIIALDVIADHDVVWDYAVGDPKNVCHSWTKGSGTQTVQIRTDRRPLMRLEHAFGSVLLTTKRPGTFHGRVNRVGRWKEHRGQVAPPCTPCGPDSEYGECGPEPEQPKPLKFKCGDVPIKGAQAGIAYKDVRGIPSLEKGLTGGVWLQKVKSFDDCPPTLPRGHDAPSFVNEWPGWEDLAKADTARIAKLGVGDSVVAEVTRQRTFVNQDGETTKGERCASMPDITGGYGECAVTQYSFTFTRIS